MPKKTFLELLTSKAGMLITLAAIFNAGFWSNNIYKSESCADREAYKSKYESCEFELTRMKNANETLRSAQNISSIEMTYAQRLSDYLVVRFQAEGSYTRDEIIRLNGAKKNLVDYIKYITSQNQAKVIYSSGTIIINNNSYIIPLNLFPELNHN